MMGGMEAACGAAGDDKGYSRDVVIREGEGGNSRSTRKRKANVQYFDMLKSTLLSFALATRIYTCSFYFPPCFHLAGDGEGVTEVPFTKLGISRYLSCFRPWRNKNSIF